MNLENVSAELRPRGPWEAADFGVRLIRRDAAAIYRVWFAVTLPLVLLAVLAMVYTPFPTLAVLLYWWLEPVADGSMLHIISRRLFGDDADVRATLRATPGLAWRNRIFLLSPYRFHIARSIAMPVTQLEGLRGQSRRARAHVLNRRIMRYGTGVTIAYQHLYMSLYLGVILVGFAFVPLEYQDTIGSQWMSQFFGADSRSAAILGFLVVYLAQTMLEPWYVGAGFGLYINCRTELEAWDLEIAFRRMVQRRAGGMAAAALLTAIFLVPMITSPSAAVAQELPVNKKRTMDADTDLRFASSFWIDEDIRAALDEVTSSAELKMTREVETWQRIDRREVELERDPPGAFAWLFGMIGRGVSIVIELGLWILGAVLLLALIVAVGKWRPSARAGPRESPSPNRITLAAGEITAATLPDDIPEEALKLWRAGERRRSLSLLYRGSVFRAVDRHGIRLPPSATEGMCIAAVEQQAEASQAEFFRKIVMAWTSCAYASRDPSDDFVAGACAQWPRYYEIVR